MDKFHEYISVTSKFEAKAYLEDIFSDIGEHQEYNIYLHQIHGYYDHLSKLSGRKVMKKKVSEIIKTGLNTGKYASLSGTSILCGSTNNVNVDKVFNYNYYNEKDYRAICVLAIPKFIKVEDEDVEFSSYHGKDAWEMSCELKNHYRSKIGHIPDLHHRKCSLLDVLKEQAKFPFNNYLLGVLIAKEDKSIYKFIKTDFHLSCLCQEEQQYHDNLIENMIKDLYKKHNTQSVKDIIVNEYIEMEEKYFHFDNLDI